MNPYDFIPLDMQHPPVRQEPVWHNVLKSVDRLYSGHLYVEIKAEMPLFIPNTNTSMFDPAYPYPDYPQKHICNNAGHYIIPGMSLKGLLRSVVETLCNGCLRVFHLPAGYRDDALPAAFAACWNNKLLCLACRLFGMMQGDQKNAQVFRGKVTIGDACVYGDTLSFHEPIYTAIMEAPKPRHRAFYLDPTERFIAGRKFYFHHSRLTTEYKLIEVRNRSEEASEKSKRFRNQYIQPLKTGAIFEARIDFTNLEADEFAALLLAITLQPDMRHKIGYGKPIGLGSVHMEVVELTLLDYATRYTEFRSDRSITHYNRDEITSLLHYQMASFDKRVNAAWLSFRSQPSFEHLHRIWMWPPDSSVVYRYPSRDWFTRHSQARIAETRDL